jgi:hypothetical protein
MRRRIDVFSSALVLMFWGSIVSAQVGPTTGAAVSARRAQGEGIHRNLLDPV